MAASTVDFLGGQACFNDVEPTALELCDIIQVGLPALALKALKKRADLTNAELAKALGVSEKTIERANQQEPKPMNPTISDRLFRLARVLELAADVLTDEIQAVDWLRSAQFGLAGRIPLELLATDAGAEAVKEELLRIKFGFLA